jgi:hypothetical protein
MRDYRVAGDDPGDGGHGGGGRHLEIECSD